MTDAKASILVVDDDERMLRLMTRILELEGHTVVTASDGQAALSAFVQGDPALVLLDVTMPGMDGFAVCRRIREFSTVPIIMVTARGDDDEKVEGLGAGADDYVTKPFSASELAARVRAVLRRSSHDQVAPAFCCHELAVDFARHEVSVGGRDVDLTATEYRLLSCLAQNAGRVLQPDQLLKAVWGEAYLGEANLLQVNITRLRHKLGDDPRNPRFIVTRPGVGYLVPRQT